MAGYWIVCGEYRSTDFAEMAEGHEEKRIGPFETYGAARGAARKEWARLSWSGVDNAYLRYFIRKNDGEDQSS